MCIWRSREWRYLLWLINEPCKSFDMFWFTLRFTFESLLLFIEIISDSLFTFFYFSPSLAIHVIIEIFLLISRDCVRGVVGSSKRITCRVFSRNCLLLTKYKLLVSFLLDLTVFRMIINQQFALEMIPIAA